MKHIVAALAIDKSDDFVIEKANELKKRTGAKVTYVHAAETPFFDFASLSNKEEDIAKITEELFNSLKDRVELEKSDIVVTFSKAWELILKTAKSCEADIVVLGNMSKNRAVFYLGSTAKKVLEKIGTPIFIARDKPLDKKILIPTDLGKYTMRANDVKSFLKSTANAEYIYANTASFGVAVPYTTISVHSLEFVKDEIEKNVNDFKKSRKDAPVVTLEIENNISDTIKEYAQKNDFSLTVLASRNLAGLNPIIFGSTASKIAQVVDTNLLITFVEDEE